MLGALTARFATYAAIAILAAAGGAKLVDPAETARVVQFLFDLRAGAAWWSVHLLSVTELTLALSLALSDSKPIRLVGALFLVLVSVAPALQLVLRSELGCGCGLSIAAHSPARQQTIAIVRNLLLSLALTIEWRVQLRVQGNLA